MGATEAWGLEGRNLVALYSVQSVFGTAVTPATSLGIVSFENTIPSGVRPIYGLSPDALFLKEGGVVPAWNLRNVIIQSKDFIVDTCTRTSGVLPWFTLGLGYVDDEGTQWARQIQDCKVGQWGLRLEGSEEGGLLIGDFSGIGRKASAIASLTEAQLADTPFAHWEAILTKGGSAYESDTFSAQVNENLRTKFPIPGAAPTAGEERLWKYLKEGRREITGEIARAAYSGINMHALTLADFAIVLALTEAAGGTGANALTMTLSGAKWGGETDRGGPEEEYGHTTQFLAKTVAVA